MFVAGKVRAYYRLGSELGGKGALQSIAVVEHLEYIFLLQYDTFLYVTLRYAMLH